MGSTIVELTGTWQGEWLALILALYSALAHAIFGAINKGGMDPYINRGAMNICYSVIAAPFALFVFPWPTPEVFYILTIAFFIHLLYETLQSAAFHMGEFSFVYPLARGSGPLVTALLAIVVFSETLTLVQWLGMTILSGAIISLALIHLHKKSNDGDPVNKLKTVIFISLCVGLLVSVYTTVDAYGVRLSADPLTFIVWIFFIGGFGFPIVAAIRWRMMSEHPPIRELAIRGIAGGIIGMTSFGAIMLATRLGKVSEVAALRETAIIFAMIIGVLIFKERIRLPQIIIIIVISAGAILVQIG